MTSTGKTAELDAAARELARVLRSNESAESVKASLERLESVLGLEVRDASDGKVCPSSDGEMKTLEESLPNDPPRQTR